MSWLLPLLSAVLLAHTGCAATLPLPLVEYARQPIDRPPPLRVQMDNGLRAVCVENPAGQTIALSAFVTTSARAETASRAGIRDLVARAVADRGANHRAAVVEEMQELGAEAYVGGALDFTEITLLAAAEDIDRAATLLRKILFEGQFSPDSIGRLRRERAANLARTAEMPEVAAEQAAAARLYPNHPFGWPPEGLVASVAGTTLQHVERFYRGSYIANNLVIVAAGGVPQERSRQAITAAFRSALPGKRVSETPDEPLPVRTGREHLQRPGTSAVVYIGARAPGVSDPLYPSATVALAIAGSGMHSRLYHSLRRETAIAYTVDAIAVTARSGARAGLIASCPPDMVDEAERRMLREVRRLTTELAPSEEIRRATEYICTSYALTHQRSADWAHQLGALEVTADQGCALDAELPGLIRAVTPESLMEAAQAMFGNMVTVRVLPS